MTNRFDIWNAPPDASNPCSSNCGEYVKRAGDGAMGKNRRDHAAGPGHRCREESVANEGWGLEPGGKGRLEDAPVERACNSESLPNQQLNALDLPEVWSPAGTPDPVGAGSVLSVDSWHRRSCPINGHGNCASASSMVRPNAGADYMPTGISGPRSTVIRAPDPNARSSSDELSGCRAPILDSKAGERFAASDQPRRAECKAGIQAGFMNDAPGIKLSRLIDRVCARRHRRTLRASPRLRTALRWAMSGGMARGVHSNPNMSLNEGRGRSVSKLAGNLTSENSLVPVLPTRRIEERLALPLSTQGNVPVRFHPAKSPRRVLGKPIVSALHPARACSARSRGESRRAWAADAAGAEVRESRQATLHQLGASRYSRVGQNALGISRIRKSVAHEGERK